MTTTESDVAARLEIAEMLHRYGFAIDDRDWAVLDEIFTADAVFDLTGISRGTLSGVAEIKRYMAEDAIHPAAHIVSSVHAEELGADAGRIRSRLLAVQVDGSVIAGQYRDHVVRTADGWRIARRVFAYTRRGRPAR